MDRNTLRTSCVLATVLAICLVPGASTQKYKLCVVDGKGGFRTSVQFCPRLDSPDSGVECVLGVDRLDCLRRISKGTVDFSVFTPEDLVTAANSEVEILITHELRYTKEKYEYEVVAVVRDDSGISSRHDLKDKRFCHPGYGYEADWTRILSNFLEASVVPQTCLPQLTIRENRIKASSDFFKSACKAGPWVNNPSLDEELKRKYPNLCSLCDDPYRCATSDKYWGRKGPLFCLTDGAGEVSWARLDDVRVHFGLVPGGAEVPPDGYSFLCPDGSKRPVNGTKPCVWVVKPWPVIATRRASGQGVQQFLASIPQTNRNSWQAALTGLIKIYHSSITKTEPLESIDSYLDRAPGFLSANSFTGCHPPRTIRICTTSVLENSKCSWLRESAAVYGIEPDIDCLKADNTTHCMEAISKDNAADIVMVSPDLVHRAISEFNLKTLFYETVSTEGKYMTVAVVKNVSDIKTLEETKGKRACFPSYDGIAWNSVIDSLHDKKLMESCPYSKGMAEYFSTVCAPDLPKHLLSNAAEDCAKTTENSEFAAIKCLFSGKGDVAFVSRNSLHRFIRDSVENKFDAVKMEDFRTLCEGTTCHLSWAPVGQAMVSSSKPDLWMKDTMDVFFQLDSLFGKAYKSLTTPLQLFGTFNGQSDVLFHDSTVKFRSVPYVRNTDNMSQFYEEILRRDKKCAVASGSAVSAPVSAFLLAVTVLIKFAATF